MSTHDAANDTCVSSPLEICICHLPPGMQHHLVTDALAVQLAAAPRLRAVIGCLPATDEEPLRGDDDAPDD